MAADEFESFLGRYVTAEDTSEQDSKNLSSNESVIGAEVRLVFERMSSRPAESTDDSAAAAPDEALAPASSPTGKPVVRVESMRGYSLGTFDSDTSYKLTRAHDNGMVCRAFVSAVVFAEERARFWGEFALICYPASEATTWETFCDNVARGIAKGDHPDIKLTDKQVHKVRESNGTWNDLRTMKYAKLPKGAVYFKKKRSVADSLVNQAVGGNRGCRAAAIVFWIVVALVVVGLVWTFVIH